MKKKLLLTGSAVLIFILAIGGLALLDLEKNEDDKKDDTIASEENTENEDENDTRSEEAAQQDMEVSQALSSKYFEAYTIDETEFGTRVTVTLSSDTRTITSNSLPNHSTGEFPNAGNPNAISAQDRAWNYPLNPTLTGNSTEVRETGVAINGVKFEPGTAERTTCSSGASDRIEAIQTVTDLGLDFNNAHVQPTGEYHYHGISNLLVEVLESDQDLVHMGFAADGHLMYYSKSGAYETGYSLGTGDRTNVNCTYTLPGPSGGDVITFGATKDGALTSDWDFNQSNGDLDDCNGITINGEYIYLITEEYPYIPRCLKGQTSEGSAQQGGQPPQGGSQPDQMIPPRR